MTHTMMNRAQCRSGLLRRNVVSNAPGSGIALWRRIADELERVIAVGGFEPGTRLPSELDIADRFGVNRHTVRRAIAALAERGLVRAERGSGTYVEARRLAYPIRRRTRFSEIIGATGRVVGGRLIASAVEGAEPDVATRLTLCRGAQVVRIELLRQADGVPICAATSWLPAHRFANAAKIYQTTHSMTKTLAHFGIHDYVRQSTRVTAAVVDAGDALRLAVAPGRPVLMVDSVDADNDGCPVLTTRARFAADRIELIIDS